MRDHVIVGEGRCLAFRDVVGFVPLSPNPLSVARRATNTRGRGRVGQSIGVVATRLARPLGHSTGTDIRAMSRVDTENSLRCNDLTPLCDWRPTDL